MSTVSLLLSNGAKIYVLAAGLSPALCEEQAEIITKDVADTAYYAYCERTKYDIDLEKKKHEKSSQ